MQKGRYGIYVVAMTAEALCTKQWVRANPELAALTKEERLLQAERCLYVGQSFLTPEARFAQHKAGQKSGRKLVTAHGLHLVSELAPPDRFERRCDAEHFEKEWANHLRALGYLVYAA